MDEKIGRPGEDPEERKTDKAEEDSLEERPPPGEDPLFSESPDSLGGRQPSGLRIVAIVLAVVLILGILAWLL